MNRFRWVAILFCVFLAGVLPGIAHAQAVATISGTVSDSSGGALVNAPVVAQNQDTGFQRAITTDAQGHYVAPLLPIGKYTVSVSAAGFQKAEEKDISIE